MNPWQSRSARWRIAALAAVVLFSVLVMVAVLTYGRHASSGTAALRVELTGRGRIAVVGADDLLLIQAKRASLIRADSVGGLSQALAGSSEAALQRALAQGYVTGVIVDGREEAEAPEPQTHPESIESRLRRYSRMGCLRGVLVSPTAALYEARSCESGPSEDGDTLAQAARQILAGSDALRVRDLPRATTRSGNPVEVLVMLEQEGRPRLWRSARAMSIARALVVAARAARLRWAERAAVMGGSLSDRISGLTVAVYLLENDGILDDHSPAFLNRAVTSEHGIGVEYRDGWHYLLAGEIRDLGSPAAAFASLLVTVAPAESGGDVLHRLRPHRLAARRIGVSSPESSEPKHHM